MAEPAWWRKPTVSVVGRSSVRTDVGEVLLGGMPARLLAHLAAADTPIPLDRLIDELWHGDPPPTARSALHVHLSKIRKVLGRASDPVSVSSDSRGYRLDHGGALDVTQLAEVHKQLDRLDDHHVERVISVLERCEGVPFAPDGVETVDEVASARTIRQRAVATRWTAAQLLERGDHEGAVAWATSAITDDPYDEESWALRLLGHARAGENREALACFQKARRLLAEDLGLEPGTRLRKLEQAVVLQDEESLWADPSPPRHDHPAASHPAPPRRLIAREEEMDRLTELLDSAKKVVIWGAPGVGKTTLALALASARPAGTVIWVDLAGVTDPRLVVFAVSRSAGLDEADIDPVELARRVDALGFGLIVLDGAEHIVGPTADLLTTLSTHAPQVVALVTSRRRIGLGVDHLRLGPLALAELDETVAAPSPASQLFRAVAAEADLEDDLDDSRIEEICRLLDGHPLAIELVARNPMPAALTATTAVTLDHVVETSLRALDEQDRAVFDTIAVLPGWFSSRAVSEAAGIDDSSVEISLHKLADASLVDPGLRSSGGRYRMLEPIRHVAEARLRRTGSIEAFRDRLTSWVMSQTRSMRIATETGKVIDPTLEEWARSLDEIGRSLDHLIEHGRHDDACTLAADADGLLYQLGLWDLKNTWLDRALSGPEALTSARLRALVSRHRAGSLWKQGTERRFVEEALRIAGDLQPSPLVAFTHYVSAIGYWWRGDLGAAYERLETAREVGRPFPVPYLMAEIDKSEGLVLVAGDDPKGFDLLHASIDACRSLGVDFAVIHGLAHLGHARRAMADFDAAAADFVQAVESGARFSRSGAFTHAQLGLVDVLLDTGRTEEADSRAARAFEKLNHPENRIYRLWAWTLVARSARVQGDPVRAVAALRRGIRAIPDSAPGDGRRFAFEAASVAMMLDEDERARRLCAAGQRLDETPEIPWVTPGERRLAAEVMDAVGEGLVGSARPEVPSLSVEEAAGPWLLG